MGQLTKAIILGCVLGLVCTQAEAQSLETSKALWYQALNDYFRQGNLVVTRGKIWAKTSAEHADIRVLSQNLAKAQEYYNVGERHWGNKDYKDWHLAWTRAGDEMKKGYPYLYRIEAMIQRRRGD